MEIWKVTYCRGVTHGIYRFEEKLVTYQQVHELEELTLVVSDKFMDGWVLSSIERMNTD